MPENPETREEQYLNAIAEGDASGIPAQPITREEIYLDAIAKGNTSVPEPVSRKEQYLAHIAENGGGGGDITVESLSVTENGEYTAETGKAYSPVNVAVPQTTVESLSVTENGTYTAPTGKAYSPVSVSVPNTYTAGDEGKVVSNGALVAQTAHAEVTQNGTIDTTLNNSVVVNVPQGGGGGEPSRDVNFYDYDGTIVASYSAADFANLSALPSNPSHNGLTAQGWNWTLADAKTYVAANGMLDAGQMYTTSDGKTRIYCHFEEGRRTPEVCLAVNGTVTVDFGDGSSSYTFTGSSLTTVLSVLHEFPVGDLVITLTPASGTTFAFVGVSNGAYILRKPNTTTAAQCKIYPNCVTKVELGTGATLGEYAFKNCFSLKAITMPHGLTAISKEALRACYALRFCTIPDTLEVLGNYAFYGCETLRYISLSKSIGNGTSSPGTQICQNCASLVRSAFPNITKGIANDSYNGCTGLGFFIVPSTVPSIGAQAFYGCGGLGMIKFTSSTPPTVSASSAWTNIPTDCKIYVPSGSLSSYTGAANYPSSSAYTYVEY